MLFNCSVVRILQCPLDYKEIKLISVKGNQTWIYNGRIDTEAETPILWPPDAKNWLTGKDPDAGKDWRQEEKGMTENEMAEGHHWLSGHEFEQAPGDGEGQGSLVCCNPCGDKEMGMTEWAWTTIMLLKINLFLYPVGSLVIYLWHIFC